MIETAIEAIEIAATQTKPAFAGYDMMIDADRSPQITHFNPMEHNADRTISVFFLNAYVTCGE